MSIDTDGTSGVRFVSMDQDRLDRLEAKLDWLIAKLAALESEVRAYLPERSSLTGRALARKIEKAGR